MTDPQGVWWEAELGLQAEVAADLRAEAADLMMAEAARCRMSDRRGRVRLQLRGGELIDGELLPSVPVDGMIVLRLASGRLALVSLSSVEQLLYSTAGLRDEQSTARSLASVLRECWQAGDLVRVLMSSGRWLTGTVAFVGADHAEIGSTEGSRVVPFDAALAWDVSG